MAVVLPSDDSGYFAASSLRRSHSSTNFVTSSSAFSSSRLSDSYNHSKTYSDSASSSAPSSPRTVHAESTDLSCASTPATNLSIASDYDDPLGLADSPEDHFMFPTFAQEKLYVHPQIHPDDNLEPPPSPKTGDSYTVSPADHPSSDEGSNNTSRPGTPEVTEHAEDDTAVSSRPSRQVDYLSHDWKEEDIWSSWRYIVTRRNEFANSARLENASWRTWMKAKNNLKTVSPETLNWLKDCDVTWLYGPLQSGTKPIHDTQTEPSSVSLSKTSSLVNLNKKPILKKRSMSEVMLQRSLSTASLLKQATAAVQAQETRGILRPNRRGTVDYFAYPLSSRRMSGGSSSLAPSTESSGITSPNTERKHIHFNEQVEQCIAVDVKGDDEEDEISVETDPYGDSSDSDDGVMMKRVKTKKRPILRRRTLKPKSSEGKTIAKLPSTTLKYREDTPEPKETAMKHSRSPLMSPSSSQETLRPAKPSGKFFFGEEDDEEEGLDDALLSPSSGWSSPPAESSNGLRRTVSSSSLNETPAGMRRTPSGMLMPYEEGDPNNGEGIFGRVIDTVNTARDIAHVIWNVGWRK